MSHAPNSVLIPVVPSAPNEEIEIYEDDPPAYQEVIPAVEEPPPTYESLFGELKQIKKPSDFVRFINLFSNYLDDSDGYRFFKVLAIFIHCGTIIVGAASVRKCPLEPLIPVFLIILGIISAFKTTLFFFHRNNREYFNEKAHNRRYLIISRLLDVTIIVWCITNSVFIFRASPRFAFGGLDPKRSCSGVAYVVAFMYLVLFYLTSTLTILFYICKFGTHLNERNWAQRHTNNPVVD